jgi:hypothetical protein
MMLGQIDLTNEQNGSSYHDNNGASVWAFGMCQSPAGAFFE